MALQASFPRFKFLQFVSSTIIPEPTFIKLEVTQRNIRSMRSIHPGNQNKSHMTLGFKCLVDTYRLTAAYTKTTLVGTKFVSTCDNSSV